mgnify:CR=1 FL=1
MRSYYSSEYLNDILYLHCKGNLNFLISLKYLGFPKIENLEKFTGLKVIYLEGNCIEKIEGLEKCVNLRSLYLHDNCIREISGLEHCKNLV